MQLIIFKMVQEMLSRMNVSPGGPGKTLISFLPLAHIFEQVMHICFFYEGGRIGFFSGQVLKILEDMKVTILLNIARTS